jgi:hypothetical protein
VHANYGDNNSMVTKATVRYVLGKVEIDMLCQMHEIALFDDISLMADNELGYVHGKMAIDMRCQIHESFDC